MAANPVESEPTNWPTHGLPGLIERGHREEFWNGTTHALAFILSLLGTTFLLFSGRNQLLPIFCTLVIYSVSLNLVFLASSLSHFVREPQYRRLFRQLDQAFIYLLITASYTPFSVMYQTGYWWSGVLAVMWSIACTGFLSKLLFAHRVDSVSIWIYLALGWIPFVSGMPLAGFIPTRCIWLIVGGGVLYSVGAIFLYLDRRVWFFHAIWHLFVMAGSAVHFYAMWQYISL